MNLEVFRNSGKSKIRNELSSAKRYPFRGKEVKMTTHTHTHTHTHTPSYFREKKSLLYQEESFTKSSQDDRHFHKDDPTTILNTRKDSMDIDFGQSFNTRYVCMVLPT